MGKKITIDEDYLYELLEASGKKMVGEVLPHFETGNKDLTSIKQSVKNSIWQNFRDFALQIKAFDQGVKFISIPTSSEKEG